MRVSGKFSDVYDAAKRFYLGDDLYGGRPLNPVVRHTEDGKWMLESGIDPEPGADAECRLDDFDSYFYRAYSDDNFSPDDAEMDFLGAIRDDDDDEK